MLVIFQEGRLCERDLHACRGMHAGYNIETFARCNYVYQGEVLNYLTLKYARSMAMLARC